MKGLEELRQRRHVPVKASSKGRHLGLGMTDVYMTRQRSGFSKAFLGRRTIGASCQKNARLEPQCSVARQ